jgi:Skp family chaperone for outer membrane proteins
MFRPLAERIQPTTRLSKKEFWMRKFGVCLALTGATVWMTGCGFFGGQSSTSSTRGGIAVVDLDKVAAETGKNHEMKDAYDLQENSVKQALVELQNKANAELDAKKKKNDDLTDAAEKETADRELAQMAFNARNNLGQIQNTAGIKLNEYKQIQIAKYRTDLKPILQEVAAKRGLSVVIPKNEGLLLAVDPGVDITDDVIKAYREKRPATPAPAAAAAAKPETAAKPAAPAPKTAAKDDSEFKR